MGDLRDQLKKANLLSKKDAKRIAHEERVHRSEVGGAAGIDRERAERADELRAKQDERRAVDRSTQAEVQAERDSAAEQAACEQLLQDEVRRPGRKGATRWYFQLPDGRLPFLELPMTERMQIGDGSLCVVRIGPAGSHDYGLLATNHARRVASVFPERVVHGVG